MSKKNKLQTNDFKEQRNDYTKPDEYPIKYKENEEPYYPINDDKNSKIYKKYEKLAKNEESIIFGGRLAKYKYYDMWETIKEALKTAKNEID